MSAVAEHAAGQEATRYVPLVTGRIADVVRLERLIYPFPWTAGNFEDALRSGYSGWLALGPGDDILAYSIAMLAVDEAHLLNLAVDPLQRRRGQGWRLLEWTARIMREYGARSLLLEVRPSNEAAQRLYERFGFTRIGVRRGYYPARWGREDALVMRAPL